MPATLVVERADLDEKAQDVTDTNQLRTPSGGARRRVWTPEQRAPHNRSDWDFTMDEQCNRPAPRHLIEALEASARDIAEGHLLDARAVQVEARRMLEEYQGAKPADILTGHARPPRSRSAD